MHDGGESITATRRAALYLRVSTDGQTTDNQHPELEQLATARGYTIVAVYAEARAPRRPGPSTPA